LIKELAILFYQKLFFCLHVMRCWAHWVYMAKGSYNIDLVRTATARLVNIYRVPAWEGWYVGLVIWITINVQVVDLNDFLIIFDVPSSL
jgi:ACR3 family arsenite efflux pump ArsB